VLRRYDWQHGKEKTVLLKISSYRRKRAPGRQGCCLGRDCNVASNPPLHKTPNLLGLLLCCSHLPLQTTLLLQTHKGPLNHMGAALARNAMSRPSLPTCWACCCATATCRCATSSLAATAASTMRSMSAARALSSAAAAAWPALSACSSASKVAARAAAEAAVLTYTCTAGQCGAVW